MKIENIQTNLDENIEIIQLREHSKASEKYSVKNGHSCCETQRYKCKDCNAVFGNDK